MSSPLAEPCGEPRQSARIAPELIDKIQYGVAALSGPRKETKALRAGRSVSTNGCVLNGHSGGAAWGGRSVISRWLTRFNCGEAFAQGPAVSPQRVVFFTDRTDASARPGGAAE